MADTFRIKRRTSGATGGPASLANAELAYNEVEDIGYYGKGTGGSGGSATSVIPAFGSGAFVDRTSAQTIQGIKTFGASPVAPTPSAGDSTGNVATTAFVANAVALTPQAPNSVFAGPASGSTNSNPTYRLLVSADIPQHPSSKLSDLGQANGAASLGSDGKVPTSQLPATVLGSMKYKGTYDVGAASGSYPASPAQGDYYIAKTAGTLTFGGVSHTYAIGDWLSYDGTGWDYIDNSTKVSSVNGQVGAVVLTSDNVAEGSTNLYFTGSRVLATVLTGLSLTTNAVIASTDSILAALGKLQAQVTARLIAANNLSDLASATTARVNLGLGSMAVQNANAVAITGGTIDNIVLDGGTF